MDIKYVAHLARIALTPEEEQKLSAQLGNILGYNDGVLPHRAKALSQFFRSVVNHGRDPPMGFSATLAAGQRYCQVEATTEGKLLV